MGRSLWWGLRTHRCCRSSARISFVFCGDQRSSSDLSSFPYGKGGGTRWFLFVLTLEMAGGSWERRNLCWGLRTLCRCCFAARIISILISCVINRRKSDVSSSPYVGRGTPLCCCCFAARVTSVFISCGEQRRKKKEEKRRKKEDLSSSPYVGRGGG